MPLSPFHRIEDSLNQSIAEDEIPAVERIETFLIELKQYAEITPNARLYRKVLSIFSRWKMTLDYFYKLRSRIQICSHADQFTDMRLPSLEYILAPQKIIDDQISATAVSQWVANRNPYFAPRVAVIKKIFPDFYQQHCCWKMLCEGFGYYSKSELERGMDKFWELIDYLDKQESLDVFQTFIFGEAFNGLGDVFTTFEVPSEAISCYKHSLELKDQIKDLPSISKQEVKAKLLLIDSNKIVFESQQIQYFVARIDRLCEQIMTENIVDMPEHHIWTSSAYADLFIQKSRIHTYANQLKPARKAASIVRRQADKNGDRIGAVRGCFYYGIASPSYRSFHEKFSGAVKRLKPRHRHHPAIRRLASSRSLAEMSTFSPNHVDCAEKVFAECNVQPL